MPFSPLAGLLADKTALIVDDESILAAELGRGLQDQGCINVIISKSASGAQSLLGASTRVDLAVLGMVAGGESSLPLAQRLSRQGALVVMTSTMTEGTMRLSSGLGPPVVQKPYTLNEVMRAFSEALKPGA